MTRNLIMIIIIPVFASLTGPPATIATIPLPEDYIRIKYPEGSFAHWLQQVPLKKDTRVFLYNGELKRNQTAQFAVVDMPVGAKDLQQCADAVMRLRAEFLYSRKQYTAISFADNSGKKYTCPQHIDRPGFERYLEKVYSYCGTLSLEKQLQRVINWEQIQPGDVLIKGGSPGHAVIVMDVAVNSRGKKIYLLAQSYMPAQDIHVLRNPANGPENPWYEVSNNNKFIITPEWQFTRDQLRRW